MKAEIQSQLENRIADLMKILSSQPTDDHKNKVNEEMEAKLELLRAKLVKTEQYYEGQISIKDNVHSVYSDHQRPERSCQCS